MALGWQREDLGLAAFLLDQEGLEVVVRLPTGCAFQPGDCCVLVPSEVNPATGFYRFYMAGWTTSPDTEDEMEEDEVEVEVEEGEEVGESESKGKVALGGLEL